jgi:hypothetical protein
MKTKLIIYALAAALTVVNGTRAQSPAGYAVPVNPDDFIRAESDLYFGKLVKDGSFGKFTHNRELTPIDKQLVVRSNRDTLNSGAVFDLDAGPVTITLPNGRSSAASDRSSLGLGRQFREGRIVSQRHTEQ